MSSYNLGGHVLYPHVWYSTNTVAIPKRPFADDIAILVCSGTHRNGDDCPNMTLLSTTFESDLKTLAWCLYSEIGDTEEESKEAISEATSWMIIDTDSTYGIEENVWYQAQTVHVPAPTHANQILFIDKNGDGLASLLFNSAWSKEKNCWEWRDTLDHDIALDFLVSYTSSRWKIITIKSE